MTRPYSPAFKAKLVARRTGKNAVSALQLARETVFANKACPDGLARRFADEIDRYYGAQAEERASVI